MWICERAREGLDSICEVCGSDEGGCECDQAGGIENANSENIEAVFVK